MVTAVIDLQGRLNFLTHKNNTDVFIQLGTDVCIQRASNIEVFCALDQDDQLYLEETNRYNPYDFWVRFGYNDFLGPFATREEAVAAEEQELTRRAYV